ncbi:hypothetical protein AVEN_229916-1 [Araneus ventricosus]|uniref:Uncharacterized protein n=1 Tax=Araneus ventricosus TaxID=182803 RepID=A0A4Y2BWA9_ARAVE|nr:hypothetical protein AVEN_229916-1 [Araneus ventricosus]
MQIWRRVLKNKRSSSEGDWEQMGSRIFVKNNEAILVSQDAPQEMPKGSYFETDAECPGHPKHVPNQQVPLELLGSAPVQRPFQYFGVLEGPIYMLRILPPPPPLIPINFTTQEIPQNPFPQQIAERFSAPSPQVAVVRPNAATDDGTDNDTQTLLRKLMSRVDELTSENKALRKKLKAEQQSALLLQDILTSFRDRGGLVIESRLHDRRVTGSRLCSMEDPTYIQALCTINLSRTKRFPISVECKFGERMRAQVSYSSSDYGSNLRGLPQKRPCITPKLDVNITKNKSGIHPKARF